MATQSCSVRDGKVFLLKAIVHLLFIKTTSLHFDKQNNFVIVHLLSVTYPNYIWK